MRTARKEAKKVLHWLELIQEANPEFKAGAEDLAKEAMELKKYSLGDY